MLQSLVLGLGNKFQGVLYPFLAALIFSKLTWAKLLGDVFFLFSFQNQSDGKGISLPPPPPFFHFLSQLGLHRFYQCPSTCSVITESKLSCSAWLHSSVLWISWLGFLFLFHFYFSSTLKKVLFDFWKNLWGEGKDELSVNLLFGSWAYSSDLPYYTYFFS